MYLLKTIFLHLWDGCLRFSHPIWTSFIGWLASSWLTCTIFHAVYSCLHVISYREIILCMGSDANARCVLHAVHFSVCHSYCLSWGGNSRLVLGERLWRRIFTSFFVGDKCRWSRVWSPLPLAVILWSVQRCGIPCPVVAPYYYF